jgi:hypothetical protein
MIQILLNLLTSTTVPTDLLITNNFISQWHNYSTCLYTHINFWVLLMFHDVSVRVRVISVGVWACGQWSDQVLVPIVVGVVGVSGVMLGFLFSWDLGILMTYISEILLIMFLPSTNRILIHLNFITIFNLAFICIKSR